jgi:uncharacterized protein YukE
MAEIKNSNFYVEMENIKELSNTFNDEIEKLTELFLDLEKEISNIESNEGWVGKSYDSFKGKFEEWKLDYLQRLAEILQLKQYLEEIAALTEGLIEERDQLPNYLEV